MRVSSVNGKRLISATPVSPLSPKMADVKLVNYDFARYGTTAERKRLLERWDREVGSIAK